MKVAFLFLAVVVLAAAKVRYDGYKVIRLTGNLKDVIQFTEALERWTTEKVDVWSTTDVMVSQDMFNFMEAMVKSRGLSYTIYIDDVQKAIDAEAASNNYRHTSKSFQLDKYHRHDDINDYLEAVAASDTVGITEVHNIGQSFHGRDMKLIKIGEPGSNKDTIWLDCGIHAREWISPAVCLYFIDMLTSNDPDALALTKHFDFYILPVANPDGYEYTWTNDRMWRKTRSTQSGTVCVGTDANRNWDYYWLSGGSSTNPCSSTYAGPSAFSEVENRNARDAILSIKDNLKLFITFHSYSQMILLPWGYTYSRPPNYSAMLAQANGAAQALRSVHGTQYSVGTIPDLLYIASGSSVDWGYGEAGCEYSYTFELRDKGRYGFILPADQIIPSGEETWEALKYLAYDVCSNC